MIFIEQSVNAFSTAEFGDPAAAARWKFIKNRCRTTAVGKPIFAPPINPVPVTESWIIIQQLTRSGEQTNQQVSSGRP